MKSNEAKGKYIAFLRGINIGRHHKVPMAVLREELEKIGFENVTTILNSGNVVFDANVDKVESIEKIISMHLESCFDFAIPTIVRKSETISELFDKNPFKDVKEGKDMRLYVSFLKDEINDDLKLPWTSTDNSYKIIHKKDENILSILNLSISGTPKAMEILEKHYGKNITTRNWNTIKKIMSKIF